MEVWYKGPESNEVAAFAMTQIDRAIFEKDVIKYDYSRSSDNKVFESYPNDVYPLKIYYVQKFNEEYGALCYELDIEKGFIFDIHLTRDKPTHYYSTYITITSIVDGKEGKSITLHLVSSCFHDLIGCAAAQPTTKLITFFSGILGDYLLNQQEPMTKEECENFIESAKWYVYPEQEEFIKAFSKE